MGFKEYKLVIAMFIVTFVGMTLEILGVLHAFTNNNEALKGISKGVIFLLIGRALQGIVALCYFAWFG